MRGTPSRRGGPAGTVRISATMAEPSFRREAILPFNVRLKPCQVNLHRNFRKRSSRVEDRTRQPAAWTGEVRSRESPSPVVRSWVRSARHHPPPAPVVPAPGPPGHAAALRGSESGGLASGVWVRLVRTHRAVWERLDPSDSTQTAHWWVRSGNGQEPRDGGSRSAGRQSRRVNQRGNPGLSAPCWKRAFQARFFQ
jgi:hypothetical protein